LKPGIVKNLHIPLLGRDQGNYRGGKRQQSQEAKHKKPGITKNAFLQGTVLKHIRYQAGWWLIRNKRCNVIKLLSMTGCWFSGKRKLQATFRASLIGKLFFAFQLPWQEINL
jgi:hypothetical protein